MRQQRFCIGTRKDHNGWVATIYANRAKINFYHETDRFKAFQMASAFGYGWTK